MTEGMKTEVRSDNKLEKLLENLKGELRPKFKLLQFHLVPCTFRSTAGVMLFAIIAPPP